MLLVFQVRYLRVSGSMPFTVTMLSRLHRHLEVLELGHARPEHLEVVATMSALRDLDLHVDHLLVDEDRWSLAADRCDPSDAYGYDDEQDWDHEEEELVEDEDLKLKSETSDEDEDLEEDPAPAAGQHVVEADKGVGRETGKDNHGVKVGEDIAVLDEDPGNDVVDLGNDVAEPAKDQGNDVAKRAKHQGNDVAEVREEVPASAASRQAAAREGPARGVAPRRILPALPQRLKKLTLRNPVTPHLRQLEGLTSLRSLSLLRGGPGSRGGNLDFRLPLQLDTLMLLDATPKQLASVHRMPALRRLYVEDDGKALLPAAPPPPLPPGHVGLEALTVTADQYFPENDAVMLSLVRAHAATLVELSIRNDDPTDLAFVGGRPGYLADALKGCELKALRSLTLMRLSDGHDCGGEACRAQQQALRDALQHCDGLRVECEKSQARPGLQQLVDGLMFLDDEDDDSLDGSYSDGDSYSTGPEVNMCGCEECDYCLAFNSFGFDPFFPLY